MSDESMSVAERVGEIEIAHGAQRVAVIELGGGLRSYEADGKPIKRAQDLTNILKRATPGSLILLRAASAQGKSLHALRIPK